MNIHETDFRVPKCLLVLHKYYPRQAAKICSFFQIVLSPDFVHLMVSAIKTADTTTIGDIKTSPIDKK
jgi:hypothetical protein